MNTKCEQVGGMPANKLVVPVIDRKLAAIAVAYQQAFLAEKEQRETTNIEIAKLRAAERLLKQLGQDYANFHQREFVLPMSDKGE